MAQLSQAWLQYRQDRYRLISSIPSYDENQSMYFGLDIVETRLGFALILFLDGNNPDYRMSKYALMFPSLDKFSLHFWSIEAILYANDQIN